LAVAAIPFIVKIAFPRNDLAEVAATIFVPMIAALVRSSMAWKQLYPACGRNPPWHRQLFAAAAILVLLVFEVTVSLATLAKGIPQEVWFVAVCQYLVYGALMYCALRPGRQY
jgi:hypothetical protein